MPHSDERGPRERPVQFEVKYTGGESWESGSPANRRRSRGSWPASARVITTLALFAALTTGTAVANHELIDSSDIVDNSVASADIANQDCTGTVNPVCVSGIAGIDIRNGAVNGNKIADETIQTEDVADEFCNDEGCTGGLTGDDLQDRTINGGKVAQATLSGFHLQGDDSITRFHLAPNAVEASEIADNAVTIGEIAPNAVGNSELADNAVAAGEISNDAVGSSEIALNAVNDPQIADNAVGSPELRSSSVATTHMQDSAVNSSKVANGSVTGDDLAPSTVTAANLAAGAINGKTLQPRIYSSGLKKRAGACGSGRCFYEAIAKCPEGMIAIDGSPNGLPTSRNTALDKADQPAVGKLATGWWWGKNDPQNGMLYPGFVWVVCI